MPDITIREFDYPGDLPGVLALWAGIEKGIHTGRSDEPAEIEKKLKRDPDLFLVGEAEGELIASVIGGFDGRRGMIYHLAVAKPYRSRGIGSQLMEEVEKRLRERGCIRCYLLVTTDNDEAMQYYRRHGWERMDHVYPYAKDLS